MAMGSSPRNSERDRPDTVEDPEAAAVRPVLDQLTFSRPVPRELVHKAGVEEVFITDHRQASSGMVLVAAEVPRAHAYYSDVVGAGLDLMPLIEICRQSIFVTAHMYLKVPSSQKFISRSFAGALRPAALSSRAVGPIDVSVQVEVADLQQKQGASAGARLDMSLSSVDRTPLAAVVLSVSWVTPEKWKEILDHAPAEDAGDILSSRREVPGRVEPDAVGRRVQTNVVIADPRQEMGAVNASIIPDLSNVGMFEHYDIHVPGMFQMEAARQLAVWTATRRMGIPARWLQVQAMETTFMSMGWLNLPMRGVLSLSDETAEGEERTFSVPVDIHQGSATLSTTTVTLKPVADVSHV